jgi:hypothetical protein
MMSSGGGSESMGMATMAGTNEAPRSAPAQDRGGAVAL